jgi:hypothetical protein
LRFSAFLKRKRKTEFSQHIINPDSINNPDSPRFVAATRRLAIFFGMGTAETAPPPRRQKGVGAAAETEAAPRTGCVRTLALVALVLSLTARAAAAAAANSGPLQTSRLPQIDADRPCTDPIVCGFGPRDSSYVSASFTWFTQRLREERLPGLQNPCMTSWIRNQPRCLPHFFVIGAPKSGTTVRCVCVCVCVCLFV